jgi:Phospholipase_D-nuclease N-terminal
MEWIGAYGGFIVAGLAMTAYLVLAVIAVSQIFQSALGENARILWVIGILLAPFFGSLIWLAYGHKAHLA